MSRQRRQRVVRLKKEAEVKEVRRSGHNEEEKGIEVVEKYLIQVKDYEPPLLVNWRV